MATKASENKGMLGAEKAAADAQAKEAVDFLSAYQGKAINVGVFEEAYPGRGEEIFRTVARAGGHGEFQITNGVRLGYPKSAVTRRKINEAVAKLGLEAK